MARRPYSGRTTSPFGPRLATILGASTMHLGVDGIGGPNVAPEDGRLVEYRYAGGWGNRISFLGASNTLHYLAHNAPNGLLLPVGYSCREGTPLGVQGMTGTATGVHVHWETRPGGGAPIDPELWLRQQAKPAGGGAVPLPATDSEDDDTMAKNSGFYYNKGPSSRKHVVVLICNAESGFVSEYSNGAGAGSMPGNYNNPVAAAFGTGSFAPITESHAEQLKKDLAAVRASKS